MFDRYVQFPAGGLILLGTPNSELLGKHGFSFDEIDGLRKRHFRRFRIFENALFPSSKNRRLWEKRLAARRTGVMVTQRINLDVTFRHVEIEATEHLVEHPVDTDRVQRDEKGSDPAAPDNAA